MATNYSDIELAFEFVSSGQPFEHEAYLNIDTGEIYWYSEYGDNEELPVDIDVRNKYVTLPHKNDLDLGKRLVLKFSYEYLPEQANNIEMIFRKKGAYSKFKNILEKSEMIEVWYEYENKAKEHALREWCKLNKISING